MGPFDYVKSISKTKEDLFKDNTDVSGYIPFLVNTALGRYVDCVLYVNEINMYPDISPEMHYRYLLDNIPASKNRYRKWVSPDINNEVTCIMEYYNYNYSKARQAMKALSKNEIDTIVEIVKKGKGGIQDE